MKHFLPFRATQSILAILFTHCMIVAANAQDHGVQISLTGFSDDVFADPDLNAMPDTLISVSIDQDDKSGYTFYIQGYSNNGAPYTDGIPISGLFTSSTNHTYQLAPYNQQNVLHFAPGGGGTLTFAVPDQVSYDTLFIAAVGGSGGPNVGYTLNFSDATSDNGTIYVPDWWCNGCSDAALDNLARIYVPDGSYDGLGPIFAMHEIEIIIPPADAGKILTSVTFSEDISESGYVNIFAITGYTSSSLPITLQYFNASIKNNEALLQWKTAQEFNNSKFIIERASSGQPQNFTSIGTVDAAVSTLGHLYSFVDDPAVSGSYLYRLSQQDIDGATKILGTRQLTFNGLAKWHLQDLGNQWRIISTNPFIYRLLDMSGRTISTASATGNISISKPASKGIYIMQIQSDGIITSQKVIK